MNERLAENSANPSASEDLAKVYDIVFIGAGYRTTSFLLSYPEILRRNILIITDQSEIGPGEYAKLGGTSSTVGRDFFRHFQFSGELAHLLDTSAFSRIARSETPVALQELASALRHAGSEITKLIGPEKLLLKCKVIRIDTFHSESPQSVLTLSDGRRVTTRFCVIASGRSERLNESLVHWKEKTFLSSEVLAARMNVKLSNRLLAAKKIAIVGSSHSAFSSVLAIKKLKESKFSKSITFQNYTLSIIHRSKFRILYRNEQEAQGAPQFADLEVFDRKVHLCAKSGIVFRDSGLRHDSRQACLDLLNNRLDHVESHRVSNISNASSVLYVADVVVQAMGYQGRWPKIAIHYESGEVENLTSPINITESGILLSKKNLLAPGVGVLRVNPTPKESRDKAAYGHRLYEGVRLHIDAIFRETLEIG
ncbi:thioredoxin reductase [Paraburkholderia sp. GAS206C]|uniref:hypothetical protein n=1 Tax=unclassified Paraburkholderia TaxID=2615204 RepID=UPI003D1A7536